MKYPMTNNWLTYRRLSEIETEAEDHLTGDLYTMGITIAAFAKKLDGRTDPYRIDQSLSKTDVDKMLRDLEEYGLLRKDRCLRSEKGTRLYTLWVPKWTAALRIMAFLLNHLLLFGWLPIFLAGLYLFAAADAIMEVDVSFWGSVVGLLVGLFCHELAHAFAAIAYRAKVFEFGIGVQNFLPIAYTGLQAERCSRLGRIQINAAGAESNLLLTGLGLLFCIRFPQCGSFLFSAALSNAGLALVNLLSLEGVDGQTILLECLGIRDTEDFMEEAAAVIHSRKKRRKLRKRGFEGHALIVICYILSFCSRLGFPVLLLVNIGGLIVWLK